MLVNSRTNRAGLSCARIRLNRPIFQIIPIFIQQVNFRLCSKFLCICVRVCVCYNISASQPISSIGKDERRLTQAKNRKSKINNFSSLLLWLLLFCCWCQISGAQGFLCFRFYNEIVQSFFFFFFCLSSSLFYSVYKLCTIPIWLFFGILVVL